MCCSPATSKAGMSGVLPEASNCTTRRRPCCEGKPRHWRAKPTALRTAILPHLPTHCIVWPEAKTGTHFLACRSLVFLAVRRHHAHLSKPPQSVTILCLATHGLVGARSGLTSAFLVVCVLERGCENGRQYTRHGDGALLSLRVVFLGPFPDFRGHPHFTCAALLAR